MTSEVESTGEGASTAWDRTYEVGLVSPPGGAGCLCCRCGDLLLFYLEDGRETRDAISEVALWVGEGSGGRDCL